MAAVGHLFPSERFRYSDPATELEVIRLTDPSFASGLTAAHLRQFGRHSDALLYWSERDGRKQAYHLDLKSGGSKQLSEAAALDPLSMALAIDERSFFYFDGQSLVETSLPALHSKTIHEAAPNRVGMAVAFDGSVLFAEGSRIMRVTRQKAAPEFDTGAPVDAILPRPRHPDVVWRSGDGWWIGEKQLRLEPGRVGEAVWSPSGATLLYLHIPDDPKALITVREHTPESGADTEVARTSQFATFAPNGDASVFAGASRSKASAYVLLLLRVTRRELTLCEHHASDPSIVSPIFTPDSQSVFFVSDRHGKQAVYRVHVEKFVEETEG